MNLKQIMGKQSVTGGQSRRIKDGRDWTSNEQEAQRIANNSEYGDFDKSDYKAAVYYGAMKMAESKDNQYDANYEPYYTFDKKGNAISKPERMKDSARRVKDSADDEFEFAVAIEDSESMSNAEERKYTKELSQLLSGMQYGDGDEYCETDWVEPMDWTEGDSVAVWGRCYADSPESVEEAIEQCTRDWADNNGFDLRVTVQDAID